MVSEVLPATGPLMGLSFVTVGGGMYVKRSAELVALVPPGVVTITSTVPVPAGATAVIDVVEMTVKLVAGAEPKLTAVAPLKFVPVTLTDVPPTAGPIVGLSFVTFGR